MEYIGNIKYDELIYENRKFIIYGFGIQGKKIYDYFKKINLEKKIIGFCDKNADIILNCPVDVIKPEYAVKIPKIDFLVSGKNEYEMVHFLLENNISRIHLLTI